MLCSACSEQAGVTQDTSLNATLLSEYEKQCTRVDASTPYSLEDSVTPGKYLFNHHDATGTASAA